MKTIEINKLLRLTLTRKGRAVAKHPYLRDGVVEAVKAEDLWETPDDDDWYGDFAQFIAECPDEDIPDAWEEAFDALAVKARKRNYPDSRGPFAGPHNSFPIKTQQDVYDAARLIGHAANPAAVKDRIISIARSRGFSLPKSWQKKAKKSMDEETFKAILEEALKPLIQRVTFQPEPAAPAAQSPAAAQEPEAPAAETPAPQAAEKAKASGHDHTHSHVSTYGYSYMHSHMHGDAEHMDAEDHDRSETAHAHEHTAKSLDPETEANLKGLSADLERVRDEQVTLKAQLATREDELKATQKALDAAKVRVDQLEREAARQPLVAAPQREAAKATPVDISKMSFDDAFNVLLHQ